MSASSKKKLRKEINEQKMTERQKQERAEAKQIKRLTFAFVAVIVIVLAIFIGGRAVDHITRFGVIEKNTIAATIGSHKLNSVTMNYFFRDAVDTEYNNAYQTSQSYGLDVSMLLGWDTAKPLNEQVKDEQTGATWADYYMDKAIENARSIYTMYDEAKKNNFVLPEDYKSSISGNISTLQFYASIYGTSVDQYLRQMYGNGSSQKSYEEYLTIQTTASAYYAQYADNLVYDDAAIREYDTAHPNEYDAFSYHYYTLNSDSFLPIVTADEPESSETAEPEATETQPEAVEPEATEAEATEAEATEPEVTEGSSEKTEEVTYTDEEKQAARDAAKAAADSLKSAATVEALDAAIAALEVNKDAATAPKSTAVTDMAYSSLNANYKDFLIAADRKAGDVEVFENKSSSTDADGNTVETITGYTVVMFDGRNTNQTKMGDVHQVFISCEGGTTDDNGNTTYSDEEKTAAHTKAEGLLQGWKDGGASADAFITMVNNNGGSDGGLVENINKTSSAVYASWALDESRKAGDTTVIDTATGCYIVYYKGDSTLNYRDHMISNAKKTEDMTAWEDSIIDAVTPVKGDTSKVKTWMIYMG